MECGELSLLSLVQHQPGWCGTVLPFEPFGARRAAKILAGSGRARNMCLNTQSPDGVAEIW